MKIRVSDVEWLASELDEQLEAGNIWSVYECNGPDREFQHVHLYNDDLNALRFCASVNDVDTTIRMEETKILQKLMENLYNSDKHRNDIDYYVIDDLSLVASRVLKTNPDQNSLYNPDGNEFTDELISHIEGEQNISTEFEVVRENFDQLRIQLNNQGYDPDFFLTLEASMLKGSLKHEERSYDHVGSDLVMYNHLFTKNNDGHYSLDSIGATLYFKMDIQHGTINCVDTKELDRKMSELNWAVDGRRFLKQQEPLFKRLCADPNGQAIAVQLFHNYVSPLWLNKPDFLSKVEDELKIYPKMDFPVNTDTNDIYRSLNSYRELSTVMGQFSIPEVNDANALAAFIEKLVRGESCCLVAPQGPRQGDDVLLTWDNSLKILLFEFKDTPKLDARQFFEKEHSGQSESIRKKSYEDRKKGTELDDKLIFKHRHNKDKGMGL